MAVAEIYARNVSQFGSCFSCDTFSSLYSCSLLSFLFARAIAFRVFLLGLFCYVAGKMGEIVEKVKRISVQSLSRWSIFGRSQNTNCPFFVLLQKRERSPGKRMDRLRRSFRDSFRRRKDPHVPESSKPHQWQADETAVRSATCAFHVKVIQSTVYYRSKNQSFRFKWTSSIPKSIFSIRQSRVFCFINASTD